MTHIVLPVVVGVLGFVLATVIDHALGISCPDLARIDVPGWRLFFHKCMYLGLGAALMYLFLTPPA